MAILLLDKVFINLSSTGASVSGRSDEGRQATYDVRGDVRIAADGTSRSFTRVGNIGTYSFTLKDMVRADIETLKAWAGQQVHVRDDRGRLFHGVYHSVPENEHRKNEETLYDVPLILSTVTDFPGV